MPAPLYSWEGHRLNFEPRIYEFLQIIANGLYEGNKSRAVNSMILFSAIHFFNEIAKKRRPSHRLTEAAMDNPEELESLLRTIDRIRTTGVPEDIGKWIDHTFEEWLAGMKCPHCGRTVGETE